MSSRPRRASRFANAPRDLLDIGYIVDVAEGRRAPDPRAYIPATGRPTTADEIESREQAYHVGCHQGWCIEMGGRFEVATPPVGLPRAWLGAFAAGVLDGADNARQAQIMSRGGTPGGDEDPWADLDGDFSAV